MWRALFSVSICGGAVAVDIAEMALPVDDRITLREILGQWAKGGVGRLVAVLVELADHVADDTGAFLEGRVRADAHLAHGMDDAAMNRLQSVAYIRQRPVHDGRQRIGEVALFKRGLQIDRQDLIAVFAARRRIKILSHGP